MMTANDQQAPASSVDERRGRRRFVLWSIAGVLLLLFAAGVILTRPGVIATIFAGAIGGSLDAEVEIDEGVWNGSTTFTLNGISIQSHELQGEPGEIAAIETLHVDVNIWGVFGFGPILDRVEVGPASLRVAENVQNSNELNVGSLFRDRSSGVNEEIVIPSLPRSIILDSLKVEVGKYDGAEWFPRSEVVLQGKAIPRPGRPESYDIELRTQSKSLNDFAITGTFDPNQPSMSLVLSEGMLDDSVITLLPSSIREWCHRLDLGGSAKNISIDWEAGRHIAVSLDVQGVRMTLPPELLPAGFWSRYRDQEHEPSPDAPRMIVSSGQILFQGGLLSFRDLKGHFTSDTEESLAHVPFVLNFAFHDLSDEMLRPLELADRLRFLPFTMSLRTDDFVIGTEPGQATQADLPKIVAQILSMFRVVTCTVATKIDATRGEPVGNEVAPITFDGQLRITDAAGAYERFPYPLRNLDALVGFEIDSGRSSVHILSLNAKGAGESRIRIVGDVIPVHDGSDVDMRLTASNLPLDRNLIDAMPVDAAQTMRSLFASHGADLSALEESSGQQHEIVDLNLQILRSPGPNQPTRLQGLIEFDRMSLTWDSFPYPITLEAGGLRWIGDELKLENAQGGPLLQLNTAAGGTGTVEGFIRIPMDDQASSGRLKFDIGAQRVTPDFIRALSYVAPDVAGLMTALDLKGELLMTGPIEVDGLGETTWDLAIKLMNGHCAPRDNLSRYLGTHQAFWSRGLELDSVSAMIITDQDVVNIQSCTARSGEMFLDLDGRVNLKNPLLTDIAVRVDGAPLQERLVRLSSDTFRETIESLWDQWQPAGRVGLDAHVRGTGPGGMTEVSVDALELEVHVDEQLEHLQLVDGRFIITSDSVKLEDVSIEARSGSTPDGTYVLRGRSIWGDFGTRTSAECAITAGRFESPFLARLLEGFVEDEFISTWQSMKPAGGFHATASLERVPEEPGQWSIDVQPQDMSARWNGTMFNIEFDQGNLSVGNDAFSLDNLSGALDSGAFRLNGDFDLDPMLDGTLDFDFDGSINSPEILAVLPSQASDIIQMLEYQDGQEASIRGGQLRLSRASGGVQNVEFNAEIHVDGAGLNVGRPFSEINGKAMLHIEDVVGQALQFSLVGEFDSMVAYNQTIKAVDVAMHLEHGERLKLSEFSGNIYGGELFGIAEYDSGKSKTWSCQLQIADAALGQFIASSSLEGSTGVEPADGRIYASANLEGSIDRPDRIGTGRLRIYDGSFKTLPISVGIFQLFQLSSPIVSPPEFLDVVWNLENEAIALETILIQSLQGTDVMFSLRGEGTFDFEMQSVSAVLRPRSSWALGDMLGVFQDRIYAISVEGPVEDPEVGMIPFPDMQ